MLSLPPQNGNDKNYDSISLVLFSLAIILSMENKLRTEKEVK